jgi:hypothetical protein
MKKNGKKFGDTKTILLSLFYTTCIILHEKQKRTIRAAAGSLGRDT